MKNQFVPYEIALKLKELGFNEPCFGYFVVNNELNIEICTNSEPNLSRRNFITAPTIQQAIDFLRNKYHIHVCVHFENWSDYSKCFEYTTYLIYQSDYLTFKEKTEQYTEKVKYIVRREDNPQLYFESYESAREAAILKAIEIINKNKSNGK